MICKQDIGMILAKCAGYGSDRTPSPDNLVIQAWLEHFEMFPQLCREDVLEAVRVYHRDPHDHLIQPADISAVARALHQDRAMRQPALGSGGTHTPEHRGRCMDEIRSILSKGRFGSLPA